jgi:hypothetical protein
MATKKQSDPEIRGLIRAVEIGGWTVSDPIGRSNIYKALCPCGDHLEHIHSTPSGTHYAKNKLGHMKKTCWKERDR